MDEKQANGVCHCVPSFADVEWRYLKLGGQLMESLQQITEKLDRNVKRQWELKRQLQEAWDSKISLTTTQVNGLFNELEDLCIDAAILVKKQIEIIKRLDL